MDIANIISTIQTPNGRDGRPLATVSYPSANECAWNTSQGIRNEITIKVEINMAQDKEAALILLARMRQAIIDVLPGVALMKAPAKPFGLRHMGVTHLDGYTQKVWVK